MAILTDLSKAVASVATAETAAAISSIALMIGRAPWGRGREW